MKDTKATLFSWIGDTDLIEYCLTLPDETRQQLVKAIPSEKNQRRLCDKLTANTAKLAKSPIKTIFSHYGQSFATVYLLTDRILDFLKKDKSFESFLRKSCPSFSGRIVFIDCSKRLSRITDMSAVYNITQETIAKAKSEHQEIFCNLSSGVPVATAATIMLASAYFNTHHFLQTFNDRVDEDSLPESFSALIQKRTLLSGGAMLPTRIMGKSRALDDARKTAARIAPYGYTVLVLGQTGTGKSTLAREIHAMSGRSGPFVEENCGSLTPSLLSSHLFGHKKGAFTDAIHDQDGAFKKANNGTLFLDEIADCTPEMQVALLRVLQPEDPKKPTLLKFRPVGGSEDETSDVRVIAATNKPLRTLVQQGKFRADLYYRLATSTIEMPSLAERPEDIEDIAMHCLNEINLCNQAIPGYEAKALSRDAVEKIREYPWPGNVRELQSVLSGSAIMTEGPIIGASDIHLPANESAEALPAPEDFSIESIKSELERRYISVAIDVAGGNKAQASRLLGMKSPQNLESRIKALNRNLGA